MRCPECGKDLKDTAKFCSGCGFRIEETADKTELLQPGKAPAQLKEKMPELVKGTKKRKGIVIGASVAAAVLILGLGGVTIFLSGGFDSLLYGNQTPAGAAVLETVEETEKLAAEETEKIAETGTDKTETASAGHETSGEETPVIVAETLAVTDPAEGQMPVAEPSAAPVPVQTGNLTQNEKIQHIRDIYNRTVQNQNNYQYTDGKYYNSAGVLVKVSVGNGNAGIDAAMRANGYGAYNIDYYYDDTDAEEKYPVFIFAVIDQKEYRYYFRQGNFIRRTGPDGSVNDSPEMNTFMESLRDEGVLIKS